MTNLLARDFRLNGICGNSGEKTKTITPTGMNCFPLTDTKINLESNCQKIAVTTIWLGPEPFTKCTKSIPESAWNSQAASLFTNLRILKVKEKKNCKP